MTALRIVDFHNHFVAGSFPLGVVNENLSRRDALLASLEQAEVAARVISTPLEFLSKRDTNGINDSIASLVQQHPDRLYGLATVDAYAGEPAAREVERAVKTLGLRGLFMESAKGDLLPDAPEARSALAACAALGVPVFLHPVADPQLDARFKRFARLGVRLTRGTINSAALFSLLAGGVFEELPQLRVVVTALAIGGLLLAGRMPKGVYIDTTGMNAAAIRAAIDSVGADHVLTGTDWPVVQEKSVAARLEAMLCGFGLDAAERRAIAGDNALRLLSAP